MSRAEPSWEFPANVPGAGERQRTSIRGIAGADVAQANVRKSLKLGYYFQINLESRVKKAHVHFGPVQD